MHLNTAPLRANPNLRKYSVKSVLPEHFTDQYPNLVAFLEGYYDYLDEDDVVKLIPELYAIYDIERAEAQQLDQIFSTIAVGASRDYFEDPREVLRQFANFYRVKGTQYSAEGFFRAFFGEDIQIEHPKDNIFIVGESQIGIESLRFIQNGALYQIFSVLIKSSIPIAQWRELYKRFVHPAGFFLGGQVVLQLPSTNSILNTMPDNIAEPPPPVTVEGVSTNFAGGGLMEAIGILPDEGDSGTGVERIDLDQTIDRFAAMPLSSFIANYGNIQGSLHINSPTFDDSQDPYGIVMSNATETMDQNMFLRDSASPYYVARGYVDSDYFVVDFGPIDSNLL